uniref:CCHC-type domain-containing protein n=1 Tax=Chenopodium quinoa TaxID=63459 RepID=A0A803M7Z3_CHEQI
MATKQPSSIRSNSPPSVPTYDSTPEEAKSTKDTSSPSSSNGPHTKTIVCFRCQGQGHVAKYCPNKVMVTREEHYLFVTQQEQRNKQGHIEAQDTHGDFLELQDPNVWSNMPMYSPNHVLCYYEERIGLTPIPPKHVSPPKNASDVCFSSCRDEILESSMTKKDRNQVLHIRRGTNLDKGDMIWLSLNAQKLHVDHKNNEPLDR